MTTCRFVLWAVLLAAGPVFSQPTEPHYYRVMGATSVAITGLSPSQGTIRWTNSVPGGAYWLETTEDLVHGPWVAYRHTRRDATGVTDSAWIGNPSPAQRTGQTSSYMAFDDGHYEMGAAANGERFSVVAGGVAVQDNLTGLMWGRSGSGSGMVTWSNAITYCEGLSLGQYEDWRLPNIRELLTLVDYSQGHTTPAIPLGHPFTGLQTRYWSSTTYIHQPSQAWYLITSSGETSPSIAKTDAWGVIPVRGRADWRNQRIYPAQPAATGQTNIYAVGDDGYYQEGLPWPVPRFSAGSGIASNCVRDNLTGLMWLRNPDGIVRTDYDAIQFCEGLGGSEGCGGFTDWRLPNINELLTLVDYGSKASHISTDAPFIFTPVGLGPVNRMSSTAYGDRAVNRGWRMDFGNGRAEPFADNPSANRSYVWAVRGAPVR